MPAPASYPAFVPGVPEFCAVLLCLREDERGEEGEGGLVCVGVVVHIYHWLWKPKWCGGLKEKIDSEELSAAKNKKE